jgi:hypothetical protein
MKSRDIRPDTCRAAEEQADHGQKRFLHLSSPFVWDEIPTLRLSQHFLFVTDRNSLSTGWPLIAVSNVTILTPSIGHITC